jgi:hypothetical protein
VVSEQLGDFLKEVSNWQWDDFVKAEKDNSYTSNQAIIFGLIRSCAMQDLRAIKIAINRLDGKLKTPLKIEMPKIYYLYPNAEGATPPDAGLAKITDDPHTVNEVKAIVAGELIPKREAPEPEPEAKPDEDLPSMTFRETLSAMADYPRELPEAIIEFSQLTEQWIRHPDNNDPPDEIPKVKSVVAANLLILAQKRNIDALSEVFDQIDGKLAEVLQIIGEDIYITDYGTTAPPGAELNKDGIWQIEAEKAQDLWAAKLASKAGL